jgi:hypothetical protein
VIGIGADLYKSEWVDIMIKIPLVIGLATLHGKAKIQHDAGAAMRTDSGG